jgi:hypothetical protein
MLSQELRALLRRRASRLVYLLDQPTPDSVIRLELLGIFNIHEAEQRQVTDLIQQRA